MVPDKAGMTGEWLRVLRFLAVGGLNAGFGYACFVAFVLIGAPLWLAVGASTAIGVLFNFMTYGGLVFSNTAFRLLPRFLLFYLGVSTLNVALLRLLGWAGLGLLPAQAVLIPVLALCGYFGLRDFVYNRRAMQAAP